MTVEYVLIMVATFAIGLKFFSSAPMDAFKESAPRLGARVERQLMTGNGFGLGQGASIRKQEWEAGL
jgi:hypothetical protein